MAHDSIFLLAALGLATCVATLTGGALALRLRTHFNLLLSFSGGAVLGVAVFDLLPEALRLSHERELLAPLAIGGICLYALIDRGFQRLAAQTYRRRLPPATLTLHSFIDGLGIGLAFQVSPGAGLIVAAGVLAHDFADGANTFVLAFGGGAKTREALLWLVADSLAPLAGIGVSAALHLAQGALASVLSLFAGFFLYLGGRLLWGQRAELFVAPWRFIMPILGLGLIFGAVQLSG